MTPEDKKSLLMDLLASDLSARLPYGVKIKLGDYTYQVCGYNSEEFLPVRIWYFHDSDQSLKSYVNVYLKDYYPYLRPMSSMTTDEFIKLENYSGLKYDQLDLASFQGGTYKCLDFYLDEIPSGAVIKVFDWLNRYHFDYRDMIQMGLAIAVTPENNPYKV